MKSKKTQLKKVLSVTKNLMTMKADATTAIVVRQEVIESKGFNPK